MLYQSITISNLEKMNLNGRILEQFDYIKKQYNDFFVSTSNATKYLKMFSKFMPYDVANQWLLFKQNKDANTFYTFNQWKNLGYSLKKGSKASYIFGYKDKKFIVINTEKNNKIIDWEYADFSTKKKVMDGTYSTIKKSVLSLIPVFGDNQISDEIKKTKSPVTLEKLQSWIQMILENLGFKLDTKKDTKNDIFVNEFNHEIFVSYKELKLKTLLSLEALVRTMLMFDKYTKILKNTNLEEQMIAYMILEYLKLNDFSYDFRSIDYLTKNTDSITKEKFLNEIVNIAKVIAKKI